MNRRSASLPKSLLHTCSFLRRARTRFGISVLVLSAGVTFVAGHTAQAANTEYDIVNGKTDLTAATTYSTGGTAGTGVGGTIPAPGAPTVASDVTFDSGTPYNPVAFTLNSSLTFGSLNDLSTAPLTIANTSTTGTGDFLTLGGAGDNGDGVTGSNAADLLYVATGGNLTINGGTGATSLGLVLGQSGNFDIVGTAAISSVISGGFAITKTGTGTLTLTGTNTYSGGTNLSAGQITFTTGGLGTTGTITFTGNSTLQFGASTTTDLSGRLAINNGVTATIDTNGNNVTFATGFGGGTTGGLTKFGGGTLTLSGAETYTGTTTVAGGTLSLTGTGSLNGTTGTALTLSGGTLAYGVTGGTQNFTATAVNQGQSAVTVGAAGETVNLGALTPGTGGTVDIGATGTITTTTASTNGILGGYATEGGGATWAVGSATSGTATAITGLPTASYTAYATAANTFAPGTTANVDLQVSNTTAANTQTINSLRFNQATAYTLTIAASNTLTIGSGGILVTPSATSGGTITGGTLIPGDSNGALYVNAYKSTLTIGSAIADLNASTPTSVVISGGNSVSLSGTNSYTGGTYINSGTVNFGYNTAEFGTGPIYLGSAGSASAASFYNNNSGTASVPNTLYVEPGGQRFSSTGSGSNATFTGPIILVGGATFGLGSNGGGGSFASGGVTGTGNLFIGFPSTNRGTNSTVSGGALNFTGILSDYIPYGQGAGGTDTISANIGSGVTLLLTGSSLSNGATMILSGTNTYAGGTVLSGNLDFANTAAFNTASTVVVGPAGTLTLGVGASPTYFTSANVDSLFNNSLTGVSLNPTSVIGIDTTAGNFTYASNTTTPHVLTKFGSNSLILTGTNNFYNGVVVSAGTLQFGSGTVGNDGSLGNTPAIIDNATVAFNNSGAQSYAGVISGSGALTKTGVGTLTLSGANFFTGNTTVSAGTLDLTNSQALQNSALQSGGTDLVLDQSVASHSFVIGGLNGGTTLALADNGANAVALTLHPSGSVTYNSALTGAGSLTMAGVGTQTFGGTNTYTGGTTVSLGTLKLDFTQTGAPASNILYNGVTQTATQTLTMGGIGTSTNADGVPGANLLVTGKNSATSTQTFYGLTLNPGVSNITITPGTGTAAVQLNFTNGLTHNAGGVVNFTDTQSATNFISLGNGSSTGMTNDATGIIGGYATVNGTAYASVNASGQVVPYTYSTTVGAGGVIADSGTGTATNVQLNGAAGTATLSGTSNGATNINTLTNAGTGAQVVTIGSGNTLRLGVNGGILENATTNQALTIGTTNVGTLTAGGNAYGTAGEISIVGRSSGILTINSVIANNNASTGAANSTGSGAVTLTVGSTQTSQTRNVVLAGNNTYSGGTYLNGSEVLANSVTAFGTGAVNVLPGSEAYLNASGIYANRFNIAGTGAGEGGFGAALRFAQGSTTISGTVNLTGDSAVVMQQAATISGSLTGTGSFSVFGNTLTLGSPTSTDTITGNLAINGFAPGVPYNTGATTIKLAGPNTLPNGTSSGNVIINGPSLVAGTNATLDLNGNTVSTNGLISAGANVASSIITNSGASATLTIGDNNANAVFGGTITDSGAGKTLSIVKAGTGTQVFNGANTYNGTTAVNAGTLLFNGSLTPALAGGSAVTVGSTTATTTPATLGGTGILTVTGATVNSNGTLAPGATLGATTGALTLNTTSGVTLNGTLAIALGTTSNNGTFVNSTGGLNVSGATLSLTGSTPSTSVGVYDLVNYTGTLTAPGSNEGFASINGPAGFSYSVVAGSTFSASDLELDVTAVPEPSTWLAGVLGLGMLGLHRRRRLSWLGLKRRVA